MNELICHTGLATNEFTSELTADLDEILERQGKVKSRLDYTYIMEYSEGAYAIRYQGVARGYIKTDADGFITEIKKGKHGDIYGAEAWEAVQKYVGYLLII